MHADVAVAFDHDPMHAVQADEPPPAYVPGRHGMQVVEVVALTTDDDVPGGHSVQRAFDADQYAPAPHKKSPRHRVFTTPDDDPPKSQTEAPFATAVAETSDPGRFATSRTPTVPYTPD